MPTHHTIQSAKVNQTPPCPKCGSKFTIRKGRRRNRLQTVNVFECTECKRRFNDNAGKHKTYPLRVILDAVSTYNLGHSLSDTQRVIRERLRLSIPERTLSQWITDHRPLTTYARLRLAGKKLFSPTSIVRAFAMHHKQVYHFQAHQAKLKLLFESPDHKRLARAADYLRGVGPQFPHHLFQGSNHRSSTFPAKLIPPITRKENHATQIAALVLPSSPTNKKRHETLQSFMLVNDSVTVVVEVPVYLTRDDIAHLQSRGFELPFDAGVITGHIDFLQVRNGFLHILDYKPEARKEKHAHVQLTIYALALSRRAGLPLKNFKCAWFDERDYFEFFPLQGVYRTGQNHA